ncbi:MAG: hypothetical protein HYS25_00320, partial [Ignavibacteriales bacterium]|nr:hypothetical protein [Ignavibacteriales bacterium]
MKIPITRFNKLFWLLQFLITGTVIINAQTSINLVGSFEQELPSYWNKGHEPSGAALTWASDQSRSMGRSLKISKTGTGEEAYVNTNPSSDDDKWWISYSFYGQSGGLIGEVKLPIGQSVSSSSGWIADTNAVGSAILPEDSYTTIIKFVAGKNATGTVWADDFMLYGRNGSWAGQDWNTQVGVPTGWFYWLPPGGGNDGRLSDGYENTKITDEESYQGKYSLKFENLPGTHDGFVGTRKYLIGDEIKVGDVLRIKVWLKGKDLDPTNVAQVGDQASFGITPIFHNTSGNNEGWGEFWSRDIPLKFPSVTSFDWMEYYVDVPVQEGAKTISVRLHPLGRFKGTIYCDYLTVEKLDVPSLSEIGSFEQELPSYWNKGHEPSGAALTWASDQSRSMGRSLKISKTGTGEEAYAYVRTEGVNTNPSSDDDKWWISYSFYGQSGGLIGEVKLPIDQSASSSSGWIADTNAVGSAILPEDSYTTIIKFVAGKNATGTVWADDFMLYGRNGSWAGQDWNTQVGVPTGWFYWVPPGGGNDGRLSDGYENTKITDEESYQGKYSLKFENLPGTHDGFVGTRKYLIGDEIKVGDVLRIKVWLKGKDLDPTNVAQVGDQASFGITPIFHNTSGNNEGWGEFWSRDIPLKFPAVTEFDWMEYYVDVPVQEGAKTISVRLHPLGRFKGTVYCDYLTVEKLDVPSLSEIGSFEQELPSYWNKGHEPSGASLTWAIDQSRSMGRSLKISKTGTGEEAYWESENMCDLWSPNHYKDVDIFLGA